MRNRKVALIVGLIVLAAQIALHPPARQSGAANNSQSWPSYGGGPENTHYSTLTEINRENVKQLEVAWTYDTGDAFDGSEMQCNPIVVGDTLYATSPKLRVFALEAATGKERWSFDPNEGRRPLGLVRNRGVTYWEQGREQRVFFGFQHWLYALDARTGQPIKSFGNAGRVDLREGLGRAPGDITVGLTTPGVVYKDLLIIGSIVSESLPAAPGHIRAYDVRTGKLRWMFHTIPQPGEFGHDTWPKDAWQYIGGANAWSGLALDEKRGLVFAPTGSATFDFYGANRHGDNLFANTLICLDAATGKRKWHFQMVRHDLWDRDLPSAPALVTVKREGRLIDAVAQVTKSGHIFVFERETGKPLFPIEYRKVPTQGVDGEKLAETQPFPVLPPPVARQELTERMLTRRTPEAHRAVLEQFRRLRSGGQFEPPSRQGTILFPGYDGGPGWGGAAFDSETGLFFVNSSEVPCILRLVEHPKARAIPTGRSLYERHCASCHGKDLRGSPPEFPVLIGIGRKYNDSELSTLIRAGVGRMPGYGYLSGEAIHALTRFLLTGEEISIAPEKAGPPTIQLKYTLDGYERFLDPDGYPAVEPPWGTLNAVDLNEGKIVWQIPLGEHPELAAKGFSNTGSWNYGGPIVTAGGVVFIGATNYDRKFRAFDKATGRLLWESVLPAAGNATPATYQVGGRQFVVIAAGGGKRGAPSGGTYVAFALPAQTLPELPRIPVDDFAPAIREQVRRAYATAQATPREAEANGRLGMMLHSYGQYELAALCYARARHFAPDDVRWMYYAGVVQAALGQHLEAVVAFKEALRRKPDDVSAQLRLADSLFAAGQLSESRQFYEAVVKKNARIAQAHYGLGRISVARSELTAGVEHFRRALDSFPNYGAAHYALGLALRDLGQAAKAQEHLALSQKHRFSRPTLADPLLEAVAELNLSASERLKRGIILEEAGQIDLSIAEHERALELDRKLVQAHINLISLYGRVGQSEKAEEHYRAAVAINPNLADSHYNFGVLLVGQQRYQEAARAFQRSLHLNPFHAESQFNYGVMMEREGRLDVAAEHYRRAIENKPAYRLAHFHLGRILVHQGQLTAAIEHFLRTLSPEDAETPRFMYALGATYARAGDKPKALHTLREALKRAQALGQTQLVTSIQRDLAILEQGR